MRIIKFTLTCALLTFVLYLSWKTRLHIDQYSITKQGRQEMAKVNAKVVAEVDALYHAWCKLEKRWDISFEDWQRLRQAGLLNHK